VVAVDQVKPPLKAADLHQEQGRPERRPRKVQAPALVLSDQPGGEDFEVYAVRPDQQRLGLREGVERDWPRPEPSTPEIPSRNRRFARRLPSLVPSPAGRGQAGPRLCGSFTWIRSLTNGECRANH
jgi:hypothetical protein